MQRFFLGALLALLACKREQPAPVAPPGPPQPAAPVRVEEREPNDYQRAQDVPARSVVVGDLSAPKDEDWFRVAPGVGQKLALRVELKLVTRAELEVYDRDRNKLLRVRAGGEDPGVIPAVACNEACFVKVSGAGPQKYELTLLGSPPESGKEVEPDDSAADAIELQPGKPVQGTFYSPDDQDWYRLAIAAPGPADSLRVETTPVDGVREDLEILLPDGGMVGTFRGGSVRDLRIANPETYSLVLRGKSAHGAPLTPYTLTASVQAGPPDLEFEPNDDAQHATPIHDTASGYLAPAGDQDWYLVHADGGAILHAEVADAGQLTVVGADGGVLAQGELVVPAVGLDDGDAFVVVKAGQTPADPDALYKLSVQLSPDDGSIEREPNDTLATAQRVTLPAEVKGFIWPRKDVDVFRFQVPAGHAPISIRLSAVPGVDLALRLYEMHGESGEVIGSSDSTRGEGEERLLSVPLKEGEYAVEAQSPRGRDASATASYLLSVR